jgi:hypothetical protein
VNKKENIRTIMLSQGPTGSMYGDECKKQQRDLHPVSYLEHKKMAKSLSKRALISEDQHPQFLLALEGFVVRLL